MKLRKLWIPALILLIIGGGAKICDTIFNVYGKGFYFDSYICNCIFNASFLLLLIIGYILSIADHKKKFESNVQKDFMCGMFGFIASVLIIGTGVLTLLELDNSKIVDSIFAILAGLILLYESCISFTGHNGMKKVPIVALFVPVWCCMRFISLFQEYAHRSLYSVELYDIIALAFLLIFLFYQAMYLAGVNNTAAVRKSAVYGTMYAVIGLVAYADLFIKMFYPQPAASNIDTQIVEPTFINIITYASYAALCFYAMFFVKDALKGAERSLTESVYDADDEDDDGMVDISELSVNNSGTEEKAEETIVNKLTVADVDAEQENADDDEEDPEENAVEEEDDEPIDINTAVTTEYNEDGQEVGVYKPTYKPVYAEAEEPEDDDMNDCDTSEEEDSENETLSEEDEETPESVREAKRQAYDKAAASIMSERKREALDPASFNMPEVSEPAKAAGNSNDGAYAELFQMLDDLK